MNNSDAKMMQKTIDCNDLCCGRGGGGGGGRVMIMFVFVTS